VRKGDNDAIFRAAATDAGKVVLSKLSWYMPHVTPNLQEKLALYKTIESKSSLPVGYQMVQCKSTPVMQTRNFTWRLSVKSDVENPHWIIVAFQTDKSGNQQHNPSFFITVISQICLSC